MENKKEIKEIKERLLLVVVSRPLSENHGRMRTA